MTAYTCKMCGASLKISEGKTICKCDYCGTEQTLPHYIDDHRANLYERANHFRRNNEFDKATEIYEKILNGDTTDSEAYWSLVLCRYGIEYVDDPVAGKRVPTVNRAQFTSIFDDDNYKSALKYADLDQRKLYEAEANAINEIQKGILAISQKEKPFDVFICYKETDSNGRRTQDSVLANDLYHQLTQEGFKVFFARITLEDKLGTAYEPYIFAALNSAKVMVVLGTRPEYFNAVWVKNEWSRYLSIVRQSNGKKILIPAYRDMDPYNLPEEFSHLQAQDMSKLGFMQDLIRGIRKIVKADEPKPTPREAISGASVNVSALIRRAFLFLEDGSWNEADTYCEKVLDQDPENAYAYLGKMMVEMQIRKKTDLADCEKPFDDNNYYLKAIRFGDEAIVSELHGYIKHINERNEYNRQMAIYKKAITSMKEAKDPVKYRAAAEIFKSIPGFKDSDVLAKQCLEKAETCRKNGIYEHAVFRMKENSIAGYETAIKTFSAIPGWKDSDKLIKICQDRINTIKVKQKENRKSTSKILTITFVSLIILTVFSCLGCCVFGLIIEKQSYDDAKKYYKAGNYNEAITEFASISSYKDSESLLIECIAKVREELPKNSVADGEKHVVALQSDGTVVAFGNNDDGQCDVSDWKDIIAVSAGQKHTVGLMSDGTVVAVGCNDDGECNVSDWKNVIAVSAGQKHTVGLMSDGTVVAVGCNDNGECNVSDWNNIIAVSAGQNHTIGLKSDGTAVAIGKNDDKQCNVSDWTNIIAISAGNNHSVGLESKGTVVAAGKNDDYQCNTSDWKGIISISAGGNTTIGLKADGTVEVKGKNDQRKFDISDWTNIKEVVLGENHIIGLKSNGSIVAVGNDRDSSLELEKLQTLTGIKTKK
ncbi:Regulator of chromosome condensation (RCC1) repeat-containing protein [Ruminococcus sp. YRD2003]|uniref:TIR domain-containing protein n=1 Tax=Ruminococcus sp. YRD2003 TaxID=1452313 RepID=UPI0008B46EC8|nr:Regulator of chromosome condensation (RCC1) repeat-containing protein [Ruminococcus flavefaciens]